MEPTGAARPGANWPQTRLSGAQTRVSVAQTLLSVRAGGGGGHADRCPPQRAAPAMAQPRAVHGGLRFRRRRPAPVQLRRRTDRRDAAPVLRGIPLARIAPLI